MTPYELQEEIYKTVDMLDLMIEEYSKAKADKNYMDEYKKVVLSLEKEKFEGSDASKTQKALGSEGYKKYLWKTFEVDVLFYQLEGRKGVLEKKLDSYRSLLSYEKSMQGITQ
jgi:hypothetical protein